MLKIHLQPDLTRQSSLISTSLKRGIMNKYTDTILIQNNSNVRDRVKFFQQVKGKQWVVMKNFYMIL